MKSSYFYAFLVYVLLIITIFFLSVSSYGSSFSYMPGAGVDFKERTEKGSVNFAISYEKYLKSPYFIKGILGFYTPGNSEEKRSEYLGINLGYKLDLKPVYVSFGVGPSFITKPDTRNGGTLQFMHAISGGVIDNEGRSLGLGIAHLSNAGIKRPNLGRNWVFLEVKLSL